MNKKIYLGITSLFAVSCSTEEQQPEPPNIIVILVDDMGYGDLGCYGNTVHRTPNLDQMAKEGIRFTDFYVASPVCSPSRGSLLTGCYPKHVDLHQDSWRRCVFFPKSDKGINPDETTIAEVTKTKGYATACIGKWHVGDQKVFLPTNHGFDYYFGIPYSNDMGIELKPKRPYPPLPLVEGEKVIERVKDQNDQNQLTKRYTEKSIEFIKKNKERPFFLFLSHNAVHTPLFASENFWDNSNNGSYGDAVEEVDWSTGEILKLLKGLGIDKNTIVIFTSDNGASEAFGGTNAPLSGYKGQTDEGGMRVPCIMRWPSSISANIVNSEVASTMDFLPTVAALIKADLPELPIDGKDICSLMFNEAGAVSPYDAFFFYNNEQLQAVRKGDWKLYLKLEEKNSFAWGQIISYEGGLYNLKNDIKEENNLYDSNPEKVKELEMLAQQMIEKFGTQGDTTAQIRIAGYVEDPVFMEME